MTLNLQVGGTTHSEVLKNISLQLDPFDPLGYIYLDIKPSVQMTELGGDMLLPDIWDVEVEILSNIGYVEGDEIPTEPSPEDMPRLPKRRPRRRDDERML